MSNHSILVGCKIANCQSAIAVTEQRSDIYSVEVAPLFCAYLLTRFPAQELEAL
ncbi:hypothetical protein H6S82_17650 [Planktothrix sp. FACHB-1355]|uniref:Uncharacterized protein n=1 Tax=Aerosakkonema funiforme FACHB-1375 TaxID=2949571 RepID=A0A926ZHY8_9CYAN|nr:hypothetical protein [Planktothrix sp. FACHB-1355]MBD2182692.1 hypothetical protein [Aerosakkonema funiforme FACHB-1375]MBD3560661.1 hypothetical protein [Planktothrix sp. FACHB-1355]